MLRVIDVIMFDKEILEILTDEVIALRSRRVEERRDKAFRPADRALLKYSRTLAWEIATRSRQESFQALTPSSEACSRP